MDRNGHISKLAALNHNLRAHTSLLKDVDTRYLDETSDIAHMADAIHATIQGRFNTHRSTLDKALRDQAADHGSAPSRLGAELDVKTKATLKVHCDEHKAKLDALHGILEQHKHNTSRGHKTLWRKWRPMCKPRSRLWQMITPAIIQHYSQLQDRIPIAAKMKRRQQLA